MCDMIQAKHSLKVGDKIRCADNDDLITAMTELSYAGVHTDFCYDDEKPCLEVTKVE